MLTKKIRDAGSMLGRITLDDDEKVEYTDPGTTNVVQLVSCKEPKVYGKGNPVKVPVMMLYLCCVVQFLTPSSVDFGCAYVFVRVSRLQKYVLIYQGE